MPNIDSRIVCQIAQVLGSKDRIVPGGQIAECGRSGLDALPRRIADIGHHRLCRCGGGNYRKRIHVGGESMWAEEGCQQWQLENAYVFDEPILNVKGKLNLFEYELDENQLPSAHRVHRILPHIENDTFVMTFTNQAMSLQWENYQEFKEGDDMLFYDTDEMDAMLQEDESLYPVKAIKLQNESQTQCLHFAVTEVGYWLENEGTDDEQYSILFRLGKKLS